MTDEPMSELEVMLTNLVEAIDTEVPTSGLPATNPAQQLAAVRQLLDEYFRRC